MKQKNYIVSVTMKGGAWASMRRKFAVQVTAPTKPEAIQKALDIAEKDLRGNDYDSLYSTSCKLDNTNPQPTTK